jgi:hypothetical protein
LARNDLDQRFAGLSGKGYGGLENAWVAGSFAAVESALVEIDLASGRIHNGYLSAAYHGGPCGGVVCGSDSLADYWGNVKRARRLSEHEPVLSDLHTFVCGTRFPFYSRFMLGTT